MTDTLAALSAAVIFLLAGSPPQPIGTAFVVAYPHPTIDNAAIPLVVTAKHVVCGRDLVHDKVWF